MVGKLFGLWKGAENDLPVSCGGTNPVQCELGRYTAFGIAAQKRVPDSWRQIAFVPDICTNAQQARRLAQLCTQGQLEPIHLMDVIEDFVADPYSWP